MINELLKAIYDVLIADSTLVAALGGTAANGYKVYNVVAPQGAALPYITIGYLTMTPVGTFESAEAIEDARVYVNVFGGSGKALADIYTAMNSALNEATLTFTNYSRMHCIREYASRIDYDPDTTVWSIATRYRVMASKN